MSETTGILLFMTCLVQITIYSFLGMINITQVFERGVPEINTPWGEVEIPFARHLEYNPSKVIVASLVTLVVWFLPLVVVGFSIAGILLIPTDVWNAWRMQKGIDEEKRAKRIKEQYEEYHRKGLIESEVE